MKLLALSDKVDERIYHRSIADKYGDIDLILGCGDLPAYYLEYVVSMLDVPLLYVPGNHDQDAFEVPGGRCVDGRLVKTNGLWIMGLGGSRRYKPVGRHQYTESEMRWRVYRMILRIWGKSLFKGKEIDIFISHSPPLGIHDCADWTHMGFSSFHTLLRIAKPYLMLHGHSHITCNLVKSKSRLCETEIINIFPFRIIEFGEEQQ